MARKKRQKLHVGDLFLVPLLDGTYTIGQIVSIEKEALNSVVCVFTATKVDGNSNDVTIDINNIISVQFTTPDLLKSGDWPIVGNEMPVSVNNYINLDGLRMSGFIGVTVTGSGNIIELMNAYYGLSPWNDFHDPNYLDSLLVSPDKKPKNVVYK
ncbi:MAG: Imm26 family immunity protein [Candidatus Thiodiazotropha sp.]|nr:immunity 26/phosphotriesterase HocA family protein [Chromatiales bacterium]